MPPPVSLLLSLRPSLPVFLLCVSFFFILLALLLILTRSRRLQSHLKPPILQQEFLGADAIPNSDESDPLSSPSPIPIEAAEEGEKKGGDERKRRKRVRKKKQENRSHVEDDQTETGRFWLEMVVSAAERKSGCVEKDCMYPFSSFSSVTQRRIKQQYDLLIKSNASKTLSIAQVGQFANCLVKARKDLQHKSEIIHRKFTIKKALLHKADRSCFSRLSEQTCKLEMEQKRLLEDTVVYNRLQEQLKLSPAFKKLLEISADMESNKQNVEHTDSETDDISFEELLAQEKKDSFWQRNGKLRTCTG